MNVFKRIYESTNDYIKSEKFKNWFGNSKVINNLGNPLVVYHGTSFKVKKNDSLASMIWFTDDPDFASSFVLGRKYHNSKAKLNYERSRVYPAFLKIEKPIVYKKGSDEIFPETFADIVGIPFEELDNKTKEIANKTLKVPEGYVLSTFGSGITSESFKKSRFLELKAFSLYLDNSILIEVLKTYGFDGVITSEEGHKTYQVWDEKQIKSIYTNN